jgi:hypothetical protein
MCHGSRRGGPELTLKGRAGWAEAELLPDELANSCQTSSRQVRPPSEETDTDSSCVRLTASSPGNRVRYNLSIVCVAPGAAKCIGVAAESIVPREVQGTDESPSSLPEGCRTGPTECRTPADAALPVRRRGGDRLTVGSPLSPEHGNRVSTGPCGDGRTEVGAPPRRDIAEDVRHPRVNDLSGAVSCLHE